MITLVLVTNPFSPQDGRQVTKEEYTGSAVELLKEYAVDGLDMQMTVNGFSISEDSEIKDGDFVVIYPAVEKGGKGKSVLGLVASVALSVVAFGVGGMVSTHIWGAATSAFTLGGWAAAAAVMFLGSTLISRFMGGANDMGAYDSNTDPTYSWSGVTTTEGQNNPIAITYGTVKSGGQSIAKYIETKSDPKGDKEVLNWLVSAGEGELTFSDVRLNDNPIEYYDDVTIETRAGTNDQDIISNFNDTYFTKPLAYQLDDTGYHTDTVQGNATEGIAIKLDFPSGLCYINDKGDKDTAWVDFLAEYRLVGGDEWATLAREKIRGSQTEELKRVFRLDNIPAGAYEVRVRIISRSHKVSDNRAMIRCRWTELTSIVYDDFCYPGTALIGLKALATSQLSGAPHLTFMKNRPKVWVYNPIAEEYVEKPADNPAWASYDLIHRARRMKNIHTGKYEMVVDGADKEVMRYSDFAEWAAWCDEKNLKCNIEITRTGELLDTVNKLIAPLGRGMVVQFGTRFGAIYSHAQPPTQMFGMGNIIEGTFREDFLKLADRANAVEITFTNKDAGYERDTLTIYSEDYDSAGKEKVAQMTMDGIVDYKQAYREGKYQLECNRRQLRTVSFEASIDSIACTVGDVILVSHDVPRWAVSGRVFRVIEGPPTVVVLPVNLSGESSYAIQWRSADDALHNARCEIVEMPDIEEHLLNADKEEFTALRIESSSPIEEGDVFDISIPTKTSKPFVIQTITRSQEFTRTITAIEYDESLFDENYDVPIIDYNKFADNPKDVRNLKCVLSQYTDDTGRDRAKIVAGWDIPDNGGKFIIYTSEDNGDTWQIGASNVQSGEVVLEARANTPYKVKVVTVQGIAKNEGVVSETLYPDGDALPNVVALKGVTKYRDNGKAYDMHLSWVIPPLTSYEWGDVFLKDGANWKYLGHGKTDFYVPKVKTGGTYEFSVCTVDKFGKTIAPAYGARVTVVATKKSAVPNAVENIGIVYEKEGIRLSWSEVTNSDIEYYEVRTNENKGEELGKLTTTTTTSVLIVPPTRSGTFYLAAKSAVGKYSALSSVSFSKPLLSAPEEHKFTPTVGGIAFSTGEIPQNGNGVVVRVDDRLLSFSENAGFIPLKAGIYRLSVAYKDFMGNGKFTPEEHVPAKLKIDGSLIEAGTISMANVDKTVKEAIENGSAELKEQVVQIVGNLNDPDKIKQYSGIVQLNNAIELRVKSDEIISKINLSPETVTIDGKLINITGDTKFEKNVIANNIETGSLSADKLNVESLSAITATIGTLRTKTSGARTEIKDNLIEVYDSNNKLRVRMGVWNE